MSKSLGNLLKIVLLGLLLLGVPQFYPVFTGIILQSVQAAPPQGLKCAKCGKEIKAGERFLKASDGSIFCSEKCFQASLPLCSVCGKILSGGAFKGKDGKFYCSEKCLSTTWKPCSLCGKRVPEGVMVIGAGGKAFFCNQCSQLPKCFCCDMYAKCLKLNDGRFICPECSKTAVMEEKEIIAVAMEVRQKMKEKLGMSTDHNIEYKVVDINELAKLAPKNELGIELGLFHFEEKSEKTITTQTTSDGKVVNKVEDERISRKYVIYLLYGMPRDKLVEVVAHELGHDWMKGNYPKIADPKVREGFAEYTAARVNILYGRGYMNKRMQDNASENYGGGYRFISSIAAKGEEKLNAFLEKYNKDSPSN